RLIRRALRGPFFGNNREALQQRSQRHGARALTLVWRLLCWRVSPGATMKRRTFLTAGASILAAPIVGRAQDARVLRMVPQANVTSIDPIWTTAIVTRNHAYIVYDTLFGLDADLQPQPQMAAGYRIEQDGRKVTIA